MTATDFESLPLDQLSTRTSHSEPDWVWSGYLARGEITLLTSSWKLGKSTLLAGLLRALGSGDPFLGRACTPTRVMVVSEESVAQWAERQQAIPIGPHVRLMSRPFWRRPTPEQWESLVRHIESWRAECELGALVVDPLTAFLPGSSEGDPSALLAMLDPLRRLTANGIAVLLFHHPTKKSAAEGFQARGSGLLLSSVDIALEMNRLSMLTTDVYRRRLQAFSRHASTPTSVVFEWTPGSPDFRVVEDLHSVRFRENWETVANILANRGESLTHKQLLDDWPDDNPPPSSSQLYRWLTRAVEEDLAGRDGSGTRGDPFRFYLGSKGWAKLPPRARRIQFVTGDGSPLLLDSLSEHTDPPPPREAERPERTEVVS